ncbi:MAG: hypothetical protein R3F54_12615 [Alphaproteobacteria bacterium]
MFPLIGALMGGAGAAGFLGGSAGGGLLGSLVSGLANTSLPGLLNNLFSGGQQAGGASAASANSQTNQLLGDIKNMLSQLLDQKGAEGANGHGSAHGVGEGGCHKPDHGHECGGSKPEPKHDHDDCGHSRKHGCHEPKEEPSCDHKKKHDCDDAGKADKGGWDGKDKSPSLDREQGAARLLEQAKETDDPKEKRELIEMALEMLGDGPKKKGPFGKIADRMDGNSYDKDIVKQAEKMLDQIDKGCLSDCAESKALDSVIDMLTEEGGVDGKPAANDVNGDGRYTKWDKRHAHAD